MDNQKTVDNAQLLFALGHMRAIAATGSPGFAARKESHRVRCKPKPLSAARKKAKRKQVKAARRRNRQGG